MLYEKASKRRLFMSLCRGAFSCAFPLLITGTAIPAGTIVDSKGFESPAYTAGLPLAGQSCLPQEACWQQELGPPGGSTAVVQSSIGQSGSQGILVTRAPNSNRHWWAPVTNYPTQRFITIDWDMRVTPPTDLSASGPFFGVDSYDYDANPSLPVLGTLGVDATSGEVLYQQAGTGFLSVSVTVPTVSLNNWHHFRIVLDFSTHTYLGYVNGSLAVTQGFVDHNATTNPLNGFTDADIAAFAADGDSVSQGLTASAVFDNFLVRDGLLGDYDIDGNVTAADYTVWKATFGATVAVPGNNADGNKNGIVDAADYVVWKNNLGSSLFGAPGSGAVLDAVPEPAAFLTLLIGLSTFACYARRRVS